MSTTGSTEDVIKAAANVIVGVALDLIQADPHQWSDRGCATCRTVSGLVGRSFGCYWYASKNRPIQVPQSDVPSKGAVKP